MTIENSDGLQNFSEKLPLVKMTHSANFPNRCVTIIANGNGTAPIINSLGNNVYQMTKDNKKWQIEFGNQVNKTELKVIEK